MNNWNGIVEVANDYPNRGEKGGWGIKLSGHDEWLNGWGKLPEELMKGITLEVKFETNQKGFNNVKDWEITKGITSPAAEPQKPPTKKINMTKPSPKPSFSPASTISPVDDMLAQQSTLMVKCKEHVEKVMGIPLDKNPELIEPITAMYKVVAWNGKV